MIQITPHMRILLAVEPVDLRKGIDGLAALCRQALASDPLGGTLFIFCSRRRHALKCLIYDGQGFWLCQNVSRKAGSPAGPKPRATVRRPWRRISCTCSCGTAIRPRPRPLRCGVRLRGRRCDEPAKRFPQKKLAFQISVLTLWRLSDVLLSFRGRPITEADVAFLRELIAQNPSLSRRRLSVKVCQAWNWIQSNGQPRDMVCRGLSPDRNPLSGRCHLGPRQLKQTAAPALWPQNSNDRPGLSARGLWRSCTAG